MTACPDVTSLVQQQGQTVGLGELIEGPGYTDHAGAVEHVRVLAAGGLVLGLGPGAVLNAESHQLTIPSRFTWYCPPVMARSWLAGS